MERNSSINKTLSDVDIFKEIFTAFKLTSKYLDKIYKKYDITQTQFEVLHMLYISEGKGIKMSLLGEELDMAKSGITLLVDKMALAGLVKRRPDVEDRRITNVIMSGKGKRIMDEIYPYNEVLKASMLDFLNEDEKKLLLKLITKVEERIESKECIVN